MTGGDALVATLLAHDVSQAFCVPGESYLAVLEALRRERGRIRLVVTRHEAGAAFAAEAYGKLARRPAAVFVTRGPGASNAAIGIHTAAQDSTPVVLFIGQVPTTAKGREAFQEIDYHRMYAPLVKAVLEPESARDVTEGEAGDVAPFASLAKAAAPPEDLKPLTRGGPPRWGQGVVTAGRLVRKKGFEYLIEALAALRDRQPRLCLALAGSGDLEQELRTRTARRQLTDRVRFLGTLAQDEMPDLLAAGDLVVVPSIRDAAGNVDGLPNVVLEALASGTPLVATGAGGIPVVAIDGQTAMIVPEADAVALAEGIDALLRDPERRRALGAAARETVHREHSWARVAERFEAIYDRVCASRPATVD